MIVMNRQDLAVKNSTVGLLSQLIILFIQFWTRRIFVQYLGVELLGISSTFSSILNTLSLAELGFQSAVVYSLYKPLSENDCDKVNEIMNVLKVIYRSIGIFFILAGMICCPFLKYVLSGVEVSGIVYLIFFLQMLNSACSYFLAYKRALFHADRRGYITKEIDTGITILISLIKVIVVIKTSNYIAFIVLTTIQTIVCNVFVHVMSRRIYPYLHRTKFNKSIFNEIKSNVGALFAGKIAGYVYSSTDNLVISSIVGTVSVGYLVNYTTIISCIKKLADSIWDPISPIIGHILAEDSDTVKHEKIFRSYTYIRYIIACITVIPAIVLLQSFISIWIGKKYLLPMGIVWLCCMDLYIHFVHSSLCDYIRGSGLFHEDKNIEIVGAIINIITSIILAYRIGMTGVLIGTVLSQMFFWIFRSRIVYKHCFGEVKNGFVKYWFTHFVYGTLFFLMSFILTILYQKIKVDLFILKFLIGGICCETVILVTHFVVFGRTEEFKKLEDIVFNNIRKKRK